ncbi:glycosyltransferase involved in cell wall biosynthesis [Evansella vedderi]|uniref:Glycosyltransferase involved in cell wall biosynthesis n=1 Tax=Evansella vedderi TaxID=38282 RepID=A0ABT9ZVV0_9BACI|nr:glycosyltransferase family 4 protein [Evansella vedderi]MDQ0255361.1 glycosyltransferase involved in cell wall biosynthesis [Evansella vedderi]
MGKHLLIYDVDWWILGYKARIIQKYHPQLEIIAEKKMKQLIKEEGAEAINREYDVISTLSIGTAAHLLKKKVRIDSSQVGGFNYFTTNIHTFKEWEERIKPNYPFIRQTLKKIDRLGAISPNLTEILRKYAPQTEYIRHFVDSDHFKPMEDKKPPHEEPFVIGWVGNKRRIGKNYETLYQPIVEAFKDNPAVAFIESTKENMRSIEEMPVLYNSFDLLLVTSANEGGPAPAMEAYSCGIPVLSTNVGYVKTAASPEAQSLILNSDNPKEFIEKITFLLSNRQQLKELGIGARENILKSWTVEKTINDWLTTLFNITREEER